MRRKQESKDLTMTFGKISEETYCVHESQVDLVILKATALGLVNATIDVPNRIVHFTQAESGILEKRVIIMLLFYLNVNVSHLFIFNFFVAISPQIDASESNDDNSTKRSKDLLKLGVSVYLTTNQSFTVVEEKAYLSYAGERMTIIAQGLNLKNLTFGN